MIASVRDGMSQLEPEIHFRPSGSDPLHHFLLLLLHFHLDLIHFNMKSNQARVLKDAV